MTEVRFTMRHIRQCKMCSRGARDFFAKHGLDWSEFLREGLPVSALEQTGDAMALQVVAAARAEQE
jgi:hypothetical protein